MNTVNYTGISLILIVFLIGLINIELTQDSYEESTRIIISTMVIGTSLISIFLWDALRRLSKYIETSSRLIVDKKAIFLHFVFLLIFNICNILYGFLVDFRTKLLFDFRKKPEAKNLYAYLILILTVLMMLCELVLIYIFRGVYLKTMSY